MCELSVAQGTIVEWPFERGHLLVRAAPGSGKTLTVVERVAALLSRGMIEPEQVLVMTFTNRAATSLGARLGDRLAAELAGVWAGTFHAICDRLLRDNCHVLPWNGPFVVYDTVRQEAIMRAAALAVGYGVEEVRGWRKLRDAIASRKRCGLDAGQQRFSPPFDAPDILAVDTAYRRLLAERHALDYDDLILYTVRLLQTDHETASSLRNRFRALFVDEFQDVSPEQYELIRLLAPPRSSHQRVMVVTDANQAIFGWRDAHAAVSLRRFAHDYRPRSFMLAENYRSPGNLVRAAQHVITPGGATATTRAVKADDLPIDCCACSDEQAEANWIARQIQRACATGHYTYADVAVLYRTHRRADLVEQSLLLAGIPVTRVQHGRFFDHPDVQAGLHYLALLQALHDDDFEPALNWPRVLVDEVTMIDLRRVAKENGISLATLAREIEQYAGHVSPLTRATLKEFMETVATPLLPVTTSSIDVVVEKLLAVLDARRSPVPNSRREDFRAVLVILRRPLVAGAVTLHAALRAGRPVVLFHDGTVDSAAAATILEHVLRQYLHHPVSIQPSATAVAAVAFTIALGAAAAMRRADLRLELRDARTISFSISAQAWRLGQLLLMRYETPRSGNFVVYDLETSNRQPNRAEIIEVAAVKLVDGMPVDESYSSMVRPRGPIDPGATAVHGLGWANVCDAPPIDVVLPQVLHFMRDATLVGHNIIAFDQPILRRVARSLGSPPPDAPLLDTCRLARRLLPGESHRLEDLAQRFGIEQQQTHRALDDVIMNARVFDRLLNLLADEKEIDVLRETLPLVGLGTLAADVPREGENALLLLAAARARTTVGRDELLAQLATLVDNSGQLHAAERRLATVPTAVAADDGPWAELAERWRTVVGRYCRVAVDRSLPAFLNYAALATPLDDAPEDDGRVAMMTIHSAKGREWPLVFVIGAEDDVLPAERSATPAELEEERRVLYVAMTRARLRLCISWAQMVAGKIKQPSRFLEAIPPDLLTRRGCA